MTKTEADDMVRRAVAAWMVANTIEDIDTLIDTSSMTPSDQDRIWLAWYDLMYQLSP